MSSGMGRRVLHDPQSRRYAHPLTAPEPHVSVRHVMNAPHVDQFYLGGCVGGAGSNGLNTAQAARSRRVYNRQVHQNFTRRYLGNDDLIENYHEATLRDPWPGEYPPDDSGSSALGLMKWWSEIGIIAEYTWTFTFDAFLAVLQQQPVLVGTNWYDDMMTTDSKGLVTSTAGGGSSGDTGHEYLASQILWPRRWIGFEQSWGENPPGFGVSGRFFMHFDLIEELIIGQQGDVAVPEFL